MSTQLEILKRRLKDENLDDEKLKDLLESAKLIILNRRYPFQEFPKDDNEEYILEKRYSDLQIRISLELYAKEGVEGQIGHTENGVTRSYSSASVTPSLLNEITPKGKVI